MSEAAERMRLTPGHWYVWQMFPGYAASPYVSPIRVFAVEPKKTGRKELALSFYNAFYASGVRDFTLDLRVLVHQPQFLMAVVAPFAPPDRDQRACVIHSLTGDWIERLVPELAARWRIRPPQDVSQELDEFLIDD
jgi:hypothetical protein